MNSVCFHIENQNFLPKNISFDSVSNIESHEDESIDNIYIQDLLDYYDHNNTRFILGVIKQKLKKKGLLSIQSIDLKQLGVAIAFGDIDTSLVRNLLYPNKKSIYELYEIELLLSEFNFEIITKKYINIFEYHILVKKND